MELLVGGEGREDRFPVFCGQWRLESGPRQNSLSLLEVKQLQSSRWPPTVFDLNIFNLVCRYFAYNYCLKICLQNIVNCSFIRTAPDTRNLKKLQNIFEKVIVNINPECFIVKFRFQEFVKLISTPRVNTTRSTILDNRCQNNATFLWLAYNYFVTKNCLTVPING